MDITDNMFCHSFCYFRDPNFFEKVRDININSDKPMFIRDKNPFQCKTGHSFTIDEGLYDWFDAYFVAHFSLLKSDGSYLTKADNTAPINGFFSLIKDMTVEIVNEQIPYTIRNAHKIMFVKNLLDFSDSYARSVASNQFWYLDTIDDALTNEAGANKSAIIRGSHAHGKEIRTIILLNQYSFFKFLNGKMLSPMRIRIHINLQDDEEIIWQKNDAKNKIIVNLNLVVPKFKLTDRGLKIINKNDFTNKFYFFAEEVKTNEPSKNKTGSWLIGNVYSPIYVFVYIQKVSRQKCYTSNPYFFDTFNIGGTGLVSCKLKYGTKFWQSYNGYNSYHRIYHDLVKYNSRRQAANVGSQLNIVDFKNLYPLIFFNLNLNTKDENLPLELHYTLGKESTEDYQFHAIILRKREFFCYNGESDDSKNESDD